MSALYRTLTGQSQQSGQSGIPTQQTLTRTTTTDPLTGTLNHLNPAQEHKLVEFKEKLQKSGWWSPDGVNGKPTHDDGTLLRYLRARKFDVQGAIGQFTDTEKWLKEQKVEELYDTFDVDIYERARQLYPQWTGHRDKRGIPIYVYVIKGLDSKHVSKYQKESQSYKDSLPSHKKLKTEAKMLPLFALYQNLLTFVLPMVSTLERPNPEVPVTNSTNIVDIQGVGLTQFWNLKSHMQDASVLATAHYPETLDRIFIIGAPSFFPTVWGWIKRWFDPVTVSKIFILGKHEVKPTLSKFMDPKDFPRKYGGELDWNWGDKPLLDAETAAALEKDGNKGWVNGPCLWLNGERVPVGSQGGKLRRPLPEVEKLMPIVYAADYTETPVHPDKKASIVSTTGSSANGAASVHHHAESAAVAGAAGGITGAGLIAANTNPTHDVKGSQTPPQSAEPVKSREPQESVIEGPKNEHLPAPTQTLPISEPKPHAPALPQPGPVPQHTVAMANAISQKLEGESVSTLPPTANGHLTNGNSHHHDEVTVASDPSKGLAIETEKLALAEKKGEVERPAMERFVTALEM